MNITQLLKSYETLYVSFEPNQEEDFKKRLKSLGFEVPKNSVPPLQKFIGTEPFRS